MFVIFQPTGECSAKKKFTNYFLFDMDDIISQVAIVILGSSAIILIARKNKWGFIAGLLSQPFWYLTAYINKQWGVFLVSIIYTISWILGIYEWFFKAKKKKGEQ